MITIVITIIMITLTILTVIALTIVVPYVISVIHFVLVKFFFFGILVLLFSFQYYSCVLSSLRR